MPEAGPRRGGCRRPWGGRLVAGVRGCRFPEAVLQSGPSPVRALHPDPAMPRLIADRAALRSSLRPRPRHVQRPRPRGGRRAHAAPGARRARLRYAAAHRRGARARGARRPDALSGSARGVAAARGAGRQAGGRERHRRASRRHRRDRRRHARALPGDAGAALGRRRDPRAVPALDGDPEPGLVRPGRHTAHAAGLPRAAVGGVGRRPAGRRAARGAPPGDARGVRQHAEQPDRRRALARAPGRDRGGRDRTRSLGAERRSVRTPALRRSAPPQHRLAARDGRSHGERVLVLEVVRHDGLAAGLRGLAARACAR